MVHPNANFVNEHPTTMEKPPAVSVPTIFPSHVVDDSPLRATRFRSTMLFFTVVLTAAVLVGGLLGAVAIFSNTGDEARECPTDTGVAKPTNELMSSDKYKAEQLHKEDGVMLSEQITYYHDSNTVLIESPGNFSNSDQATYAIDFERRVVFIKISSRNMCVGFDLDEVTATEVKALLEEPDDTVVELTSASIDTVSYDIVGEIPNEYLETASGAIVSEMCSGSTTHWAQRSNSDVAGREKRARAVYVCRCCSCCRCCICQLIAYIR